MLNIVTETAHTVELLVIKMELSLMENLVIKNAELVETELQ